MRCPNPDATNHPEQCTPNQAKKHNPHGAAAPLSCHDPALTTPTRLCPHPWQYQARAHALCTHIRPRGAQRASCLPGRAGAHALKASLAHDLTPPHEGPVPSWRAAKSRQKAEPDLHPHGSRPARQACTAGGCSNHITQQLHHRHPHKAQSAGGVRPRRCTNHIATSQVKTTMPSKVTSRRRNRPQLP